MTSGAACVPVFRLRCVALLLGLAVLAAVLATPVRAQGQDNPTIEELLSAVVKLDTRVPQSARTAALLGTERQGSGVVVGKDGLIVTIGYLILEADRVDVTLQDGTRIPATVVGYDPYSGFGAVRALKPIAAQPLKLGRTSALRREDPVLVVQGGPGDERVHSAVVVSRRVFAGYWEYLLERALFTSPPVEGFAGAALFDKDLKLVGIGSLFVRDASEGMELPGNMFVPVDDLGALLPDLVKLGRSSAPARPWLGVLFGEMFDHVVITRVNPDGPAERAGLRAGDIVVEVAGRPVSSMEGLYRDLWALGNAGMTVTLKVLQGHRLNELAVRTIDRQLYYRSAAN